MRIHGYERGVGRQTQRAICPKGWLLGDDFLVELHAVERRIDPPPDNPHIAAHVSFIPLPSKQVVTNYGLVVSRAPTWTFVRNCISLHEPFSDLLGLLAGCSRRLRSMPTSWICLTSTARVATVARSCRTSSTSSTTTRSIRVYASEQSARCWPGGHRSGGSCWTRYEHTFAMVSLSRCP
jgi:hypothetical protein